MARIEFHNATDLCEERLLRHCRDALDGWATGMVTVRIRYSRGADFSGTCWYNDGRIHVNLGRHLAYPYRMTTYIARSRTVGRQWFKPAYHVTLADGYGVVMFVFVHELYHLLVKRARRNTRQKESMCDRFAARFVVDRFHARVTDSAGRPVSRSAWDFQDLDGFVAAARDRRVRPAPATAARRAVPMGAPEQLTLFRE